MIAVNPNQTFDLVLKEERALSVDSQTVFILKPLTAAEYAKTKDALMEHVTDINGSRTQRMKFAEQELLVLSQGLKGWRNLKDTAGVEVPFTAVAAALDLLPPHVRLELANAIMGEK